MDKNFCILRMDRTKYKINGTQHAINAIWRAVRKDKYMQSINVKYKSDTDELLNAKRHL